MWWIMSHASHIMNESCHMYERMCHATYPSFVEESFHVYMLAIVHIWISQVTCMHESCHVYSYDIWTSRVAYMNESCHTYEWVMSHTCMNHVIYMNKSFHIYERVISHIWISQSTYMNKSRHIYEWVTSPTHTCIYVYTHIHTHARSLPIHTFSLTYTSSLSHTHTLTHIHRLVRASHQQTKLTKDDCVALDVHLVHWIYILKNMVLFAQCLVRASCQQARVD